MPIEPDKKKIWRLVCAALDYFQNFSLEVQGDGLIDSNSQKFANLHLSGQYRDHGMEWLKLRFQDTDYIFTDYKVLKINPA